MSMQPNKPNRVITALLVVASSIYWGGNFISGGLAALGSAILLVGIAFGVTALICSDETFRKFPWLW